MLAPTKYHWNISFQQKLSSKYKVKNANSVTHFGVTIFFFHWISRVYQIKNSKYIHQNLRYYETIVQLLYLSGNNLPLLICYTNKMVTLKNLILKYKGRKKINILKRKSHVGINVVFLEVILRLYDVRFMKNICIAPSTCLHCFDLLIIIRRPENVRRVNKICLQFGHFIHCYILLNCA